MKIDWKNMDKEEPQEGQRILVYSKPFHKRMPESKGIFLDYYFKLKYDVLGRNKGDIWWTAEENILNSLPKGVNI